MEPVRLQQRQGPLRVSWRQWRRHRQRQCTRLCSHLAVSWHRLLLLLQVQRRRLFGQLRPLCAPRRRRPSLLSRQRLSDSQRREERLSPRLRAVAECPGQRPSHSLRAGHVQGWQRRLDGAERRQMVTGRWQWHRKRRRFPQQRQSVVVGSERAARQSPWLASRIGVGWRPLRPMAGSFPVPAQLLLLVLLQPWLHLVLADGRVPRPFLGLQRHPVVDGPAVLGRDGLVLPLWPVDRQQQILVPWVVQQSLLWLAGTRLVVPGGP